MSAEAQASPAAAAEPRGRARRLELASGAPLLAVLFAAGALISGFTILRRIDPFDEGIALQAARRVMQGQVPYGDFLWAYGPAHPYLLAGLFKAFGVSLLDWRILRIASDAAAALAAFVLARRLAGPWLALLAWLAAACAMAQPTSANPFAEALAFGLWALVAVTGPEGPGRRELLLAGAATALAAAWRLDFAAYAAFAVLVALALRPGAGAGRIGLYTGATLLLTAAVYLPFVIVAGPHTAYEGLIANSAREGSYWRLPFPIDYNGAFALWPPWTLLKRSKDVLVFYVPLLLLVAMATAIAATALRAARERSAPWLAGGLLAFAVGGLLYMLSRTDDLHTAPLLAIVAPLLAAATAWLAGRRPAAAALPLAVLALLAAYGVSNRLSALFVPPKLQALHVPVADGVEDTPENAHALDRVVPLVKRLVPPRGYLYVAPRRSDLVRINDALLYVLTERDNPLDRDFGLQTSAASQASIVSVLRRTRPRAVVRWTDPASSRPEPNKRGRSSGSHILDEYLATDYRPLERDGFYDVLVRR